MFTVAACPTSSDKKVRFENAFTGSDHGVATLFIGIFHDGAGLRYLEQIALSPLLTCMT